MVGPRVSVKISVFVTFVAVVLLCGIPSWGIADDDDFDIEKYLVENVYSKFSGTSGFLVGCVLQGSAEEIGFDQQKMRDRIKLRLANTISKVPLIKESDDVESNPGLYSRVGLVSITIWTVGEDYPVAYHVKIGAGILMGDSEIFTTAVLGYGNSKNVIGSAEDVIDDLVDDFAVAYHKGVGDF